jgi:uncharacterized membrane protein
MWYTSRLAVAAVICFIISCVTYAIDDTLSTEPIWWMLVAIFLVVLPGEFRRED